MRVSSRSVAPSTPRADVGRVPPTLLSVLEYVLLGVVLALTQVLSVQVWGLPNGDVDEYYRYAIAFWTQHPIAHALPVEYPPLAIVPFTFTLLPPLPGLAYHSVFAVWMGAFVLLSYAGIRRRAGVARALVSISYLVLGTAATLLARFDIVPALLTLAALWATERRHFGYAYILLALGVLLKLYPLFLLPIVLIAHWHAAEERLRPTDAAAPAVLAASSAMRANSGWRGRAARLASPLRRQVAWRVGRGALLCLGLVLLGFLCALLLNPTGALSTLTYAGERPLQVESLPASVLWLGSLVGIPARPDYSFVSLNFVGPLDVLLRPLSALALALGCLWVYWRQARGRLSASQAFVAVVCVILVTNKLFSPQYLIWVLPLVAYVEGFDVLWIAICLLTWYDFPILYQLRHPIQTVTYTGLFMPVLALRNGLLLWATLRVIMRRKAAARSLPADAVPHATQPYNT